MIKYSTASPAHPIGGCAKGEQMSKTVSNVNHVSLRASRNRRDLGHDQEPKEDPYSVAPRSHQRRWSADLCQCGSSHVIVVRKNKKEPQPPQRGVSLLKPNTAQHPSMKSYSYSHTGTSGHPHHPYSSSSSSSSFTSSPPYVQTSVITGKDPLGWRLRPKSSPSVALTHRLSLQIPLPVISPELKRSPAPNASDPDLFRKTKTPLGPKPSRRHHSDSSAFLRSLATPLPVVTADELCTVHLRSITPLDKCDYVFCRGNEEEVRVTPPIPEKTSTAREMARLIAHSHKPCKTNEEHIYISVMKPIPKRSHPTDN